MLFRDKEFLIWFNLTIAICGFHESLGNNYSNKKFQTLSILTSLIKRFVLDNTTPFVKIISEVLETFKPDQICFTELISRWLEDTYRRDCPRSCPNARPCWAQINIQVRVRTCVCFFVIVFVRFHVQHCPFLLHMSVSPPSFRVHVPWPYSCFVSLSVHFYDMCPWPCPCPFLLSPPCPRPCHISLTPSITGRNFLD